MATRAKVTLEDDLDGGPAAETLRFGLGAAEYEMDLSAANAALFRAQLAPFTVHARKAGPGQRTRPGRASAARRNNADIRAWAKEHGLEISERGRIPAGITERYEAAAAGR